MGLFPPKRCLEDLMSEKPLALVVDDQPRNLQIVGHILSTAGYGIAIANGGQRAIDTINPQSPPDIILLDVMMPDMDGFEACSIIKANPLTAHIPIIFLTAKTEVDDIAKGFAVGGADYVAKPFNSVELLARVKVHVENVKTKRKLLEANAARGAFLHMLTHDLKNPIGAVISLLDLTAASPNDFITYLPDIRMGLAQSVSLIDMARTYLAVDSGKVVPDLMPVLFADAASMARHELQGRFDAKNVKLTIEDSGNVLVEAEPASLVHSVLNNLLTNALKFSEPGTEVVMRLDCVGEQAIIFIVDKGIGIPPAILNNLFDVTKPTSRTGTTGEIGTGFGMPLVKKFVEAYGGSLEVTSRDIITFPDNHGTEIRILLKMAP